ncbi:uncharacterized protein [Haliotis cracherodii]|uniref:uncharacterized protein n=1 Tax=Haliotis cracherodii TaxID=6455 RepID=UPI0039EB84DA
MGCLVGCSRLFKVASLILFLGLIVNAIGFASPFWSNRSPDIEGLWQICGNGVCEGTVFNPLSSSDWFIANQVLQTVGLGLAFIGVIIALSIMCSACLFNCFNTCGILLTIHALLAAILLIAGLTLYGVQAKILDASINFLFAFWLTLAAGGLYLVSGILFSVSVDRDWKHDDDAVE